MKKNNFAILFLLFFAVIFSACADSNPPRSTDDAKVAGEIFHDFNFEYPGRWEIDKNSAMITVYSPVIREEMIVEGERFTALVRPNVSAASGFLDDPEIDLREYMSEQYFPKLSEIFSDIDRAEPVEILLDGEAALRYDFTANLAGEKFRYAVAVATRRGRIYTLTYTAAPETFAASEYGFTMILETFTFK